MKKNRSLIAAFMFAVVSLMLPAVNVGAQTANQGGNGLSITPTRFEFTVEQGQAELIDLQLKNVSDRDILAKAFLNDFEQEGTTGNPKLLVGATESSSNSIREFVVGLEDVLVKSGETVAVNIPLQVPDNAAPGAYFGAIRFQSTIPGSSDSTETPQVALNASVAALVLVEVPGDITEKIEISSVSAYRNDARGSLFTSNPDQIGIEINNLGNGFSKPFGKVTVNGPWGTGEIQSYELNDVSPRGNVLPYSKRLFLNDLSGVKWPGRYTINANISHGRGGQVLSATSSFWFIPSWLIVVLLVLLAALVATVWYVVRKYKNRTTTRRR